jgi:glycosyltransferase involved in cell wall biosynthesis
MAAAAKDDGPRRLSVDFINHGAPRPVVMGHATVENAFRAAFAGSATIDARFTTLPAWSVAARLASGRWQPMNRFGVDLQPTRWHLVEGYRGRLVAKKILRDRHPEVLHVTSHTAAFGLRGLKVPYVVLVDATVDEWESLGFGPGRHTYPTRGLGVSRGLERRTFEDAAGIVAMSEWSAAGVRAVLPNAEVRVIHPGLDLELYRQGPPGERSGEGDARILFVGGRFQEKGGQVLLRAMESLVGSGFVLDVVSPDPPISAPNTRWHRFRGSDPRLLQLYQAADVLCLPTFRDAVPWVVAESFASGTPVIATDIGALPEMIGGQSERGKLVPAGDADALRQAFLDVAGDPDAWRARGLAAREYAEQHFDVRKNAGRLESLIREVDRAPRRDS